MKIVKKKNEVGFSFCGPCKIYDLSAFEGSELNNIIVYNEKEISCSNSKIARDADGNFYWTDSGRVQLYTLQENQNGNYVWIFQNEESFEKNDIKSFSNHLPPWASYNIYDNDNNLIYESIQPIPIKWMTTLDWDGTVQENTNEVVDGKVYQKIDEYVDIKDFLIQINQLPPTNVNFEKIDEIDGWKIYDNRKGLNELIAYGRIPRYGNKEGAWPKTFVDGGIFFLAQKPSVPICFCYHVDNYLQPRQTLEDRITEIANAVREKTYIQNKIPLEDIPDKIRNIVSYRTINGTTFQKKDNIVTEKSVLEDGSGYESKITFDTSGNELKAVKVTGGEGQIDIVIERDDTGKAKKIFLNGREFPVAWEGFL